MNFLMRNMIFTALKSKIEGDMKTKNLLDKSGKLQQISFIVVKEKTTMRVKFEKYSNDADLLPEERKKFSSLVGIDIEKEIATCHTILASLFFDTKKIIINKIFKDKPNEITTI